MTEHTSPLGTILARVLVEHEYQTVTSPLRPACRCGWAAEAEWSAVTVYDAHFVAEFERAVAEDEELQHIGAHAIHRERCCPCDPHGCPEPSGDEWSATALVIDALTREEDR